MMVAKRVYRVVWPNGKREFITDWDLWGPLILCVMLGITMSMGESENESALRFTLVFCIVSGGAVVITINGKLLGGNLNFFQSVCTLGYCLFPMNVASLFGLFVESGIL